MTDRKDRGRRKKPEHQIKIAKERMPILLDEAEKARKERPDLACSLVNNLVICHYLHNIHCGVSAK